MTHHLAHEDIMMEAFRDAAFKRIWEANTAKREITKTIIRERIRRNLTQEQLAKRAGLKQPSLARVESGSVSPSLLTLTRIAQALGKKLEVNFT